MSVTGLLQAEKGRALTVSQLSWFLEELVSTGKGDLPVLFDTEAQKYHYHMADVATATVEDEPSPHLVLSEDKPHHTCTEECKE